MDRCGTGLVLFALAIAASMAGPALSNTPPQVTNVRAEQREGTTLVDIYYDLWDADGDTMCVLALCTGSEGQIAVVSVVPGSDLGEGVVSGPGRHITWDAGIDWPENASSDNAISIIAYDDYFGRIKMEAYVVLCAVSRSASWHYRCCCTFEFMTFDNLGLRGLIDNAEYFSYSLTGLSCDGFCCVATLMPFWGPPGAGITYTRTGAEFDPDYPFCYWLDLGTGSFCETGW